MNVVSPFIHPGHQSPRHECGVWFQAWLRSRCGVYFHPNCLVTRLLCHFQGLDVPWLAWCTDRAVGGAEALGDVGGPPQLRMPILPFKLNQDCRHHIPRQQRKVTNWPAYDASLRQRGSLTV